MPKPKKISAIFVRTTPALIKKFAAYCKKEGRSMNKMVIYMIEKVVD